MGLGFYPYTVRAQLAPVRTEAGKSTGIFFVAILCSFHWPTHLFFYKSKTFVHSKDLVFPQNHRQCQARRSLRQFWENESWGTENTVQVSVSFLIIPADLSVVMWTHSK